MITGEQYKRSLDDGRRIFLEGKRITDLCTEPTFAAAVDWTARGYDRFYDSTPGATNPLMEAPASREELNERATDVRDTDMLTNTTYQSLMTLVTVAPTLGRHHPELAERIHEYRRTCLAEDLRIAECITDAKGDRSLSPGKQSDPDSYVHVVERRKDGVVIRGAKLHITGAALAHELMVLPTKRMSPGEEDYAIACGVAVNTPGVRVINTTYAPRSEDDRHFPITRIENMPDGFVIFDDVFVPNERVFMDGLVEHSATFAHSLGLWERLGGTALMADEADLLVGLAQLIAEANGLSRVEHVREKISELIVYATLIRAGLEAAILHAHTTDDGFLFPDELYTNAAKFHGASQYNTMVRHLHDIAGGGVLTAPTIADLENPELAPFVEKYMRTSPDVSAEYRMRLFHAIRDLTADAFGGWHFVTNLQSGGGLYAQRLVTRKHYDMERAKKIAKHAAGVDQVG
ncbi:MAG: 4-hydroxyphenylacetate 3-hydroxylase [Ilumatobacteraceae bacterium]|nr:4-hydroxyphenylacetate 3-hydroxylase [Ilumatobacteraceae bacterium]